MGWMTQHIGIIGGGLSGAAFCVAMMRMPTEDTTLHLIEPEELTGGGIAYGLAAPWHSLNVTADRASLLPDDPDHWWQWAAIHGPQLDFPQTATANAESYLPRKLFGIYAAALLYEAEMRSAGPRLVRHRARVDALSRLDGGFRLRLSDGQTLDCGKVVLSVGSLPVPSLCLPGLDEAYRLGRIFDNPWNLDALAGIGKLPGIGGLTDAHGKSRVLIAGTGLTMADTVMSLRRVGYEGEIVAISRHGVVPAPRSAARPGEPVVNAQARPLRLSRLLHQLRQSSRQSPSGDWQEVFESLRPITRSLWENLDDDARRRFVRHGRTFWDAHRFRMPPETAAELQADQQAGRLHVVKGRFIGIVARDDGLAVDMRRRFAADSETLQADALILCTGPRQDDAEAVLLRDMQQAGLIRPDASGMGLDADPDGQMLDADGKAVPGLYSLGPPLRGMRLECTAITDIRNQAVDLAQLMATQSR